MNNNIIFKNLLHLTGCGRDKKLIEEIFKLGGITASQSKIRAWRYDPSSEKASHMPDSVLDGFFQGMFQYRDINSKNGRDVFCFPARKQIDIDKINSLLPGKWVISEIEFDYLDEENCIDRCYINAELDRGAETELELAQAVGKTAKQAIENLIAEIKKQN